ncbi:hypothetical protein E5288_WYG014394 [Bos mutus]|uniref:Uncharacterized protein n=1 Tax=Bos mutus TaxID=72004 RepID=A0A6B0R6B0_9CETA|nr:hypothetical protein [Bos mutus]
MRVEFKLFILQVIIIGLNSVEVKLPTGGEIEQRKGKNLFYVQLRGTTSIYLTCNKENNPARTGKLRMKLRTGFQAGLATGVKTPSPAFHVSKVIMTGGTGLLWGMTGHDYGHRGLCCFDPGEFTHFHDICQIKSMQLHNLNSQDMGEVLRFGQGKGRGQESLESNFNMAVTQDARLKSQLDLTDHFSPKRVMGQSDSQWNLFCSAYVESVLLLLHGKSVI